MQGCDDLSKPPARGTDRFLTNDKDEPGIAHLLRLTARWANAEFCPPLFAALYFLCWQIARHGRYWAARKSRHDKKPDHAYFLAAIDSLPATELADLCLDGLQRYGFRAVRPEVPAALCQWLQGNWQLILCTDVPTPRAVLEMQARGARPVTVIADYPAMLAPVHDKVDGFHFLLHDLEHAHRFFEDPASHRAQCRLAQALMAELDSSHFDSYLGDPLFCAKFDYLIADMNTHVAHALHYLRAILVDFHLRQAGTSPDAPLSRDAAHQIATHISGLANAVGLSMDAFNTRLRATGIGRAFTQFG